MGISSLSGRLEKLLEMATEAPEGEARVALDDMIADALSFPSIIQDMVAASQNRAVAIGRLADVVTGRFAPAPGERVDPILTNFVKLRGEIGLDRSTGVMLDWVIREVASRQAVRPSRRQRRRAAAPETGPASSRQQRPAFGGRQDAGGGRRPSAGPAPASLARHGHA